MKKTVAPDWNEQFYISDRNSLWDFLRALLWLNSYYRFGHRLLCVTQRANSRGRADFPGSPHVPRSFLVGRGFGNRACPSSGAASSLVGPRAAQFCSSSLPAQPVTGWRWEVHFGLKTLLHPRSSDVVVFSISDIVKLELYKNIILWVYKVCVIAWIYKFLFQKACPISGPGMFGKQWQGNKKSLL